MNKTEFQYGGQAVINGVMIRGKSCTAVAVRLSNNQIRIIEFENVKIAAGRLRDIPIIRGILVLFETILLGIKATIFSAQVASQDEIQQEISSVVLWFTIILSVTLGIAIFFIIPLIITNYLIFPILKSAILSNFIEGVIRILFFILYLILISIMKDIKTIFQYHGAEHKVINAWEAQDILQIAAIRKYGIVHLRCGTAFMFFVLIVAILVFSIFSELPLWAAIITRVLLIPLIAGISYEIVKLASMSKNREIAQIFIYPSLALQKLTTCIPDDQQIEVALVALQRVLTIDGRKF